MPERRFCTGCTFLLVLMIMGVLLAGCDSIRERQEKAAQVLEGLQKTASGTVAGAVGQIRNTVDMGKSVMGTVQEGVAGVKRRVDSVEQGVKKIQEGKTLIEEGLGN